MLRTFAATLLATALIAGPSLAAPPSGNSGASPSAPAVSDAKAANQQTNASKPSKTVKPVSRKHQARGKAGRSKLTRHLESTKTHRHLTKPVKSVKNSKSDRLQTAKLPATSR
jgi:hypothetical protein